MKEKEKSEEEPFRVVTSRRKKKSNHKVTSSVILNSESNQDIDQDAVLDQIKKITEELRETQYFANFNKNFSKLVTDCPKEIVCFGIGHFGDCLISRHQLSFILALQTKFEINNISFHEPILSRAEFEILKRLDCNVKLKNLEGKVDLDSSKLTIIYSPHCPKQLTNNLLWKNWSLNTLQNIIYIGNSFGNILSSTPSRYLEADAKFIVKIQPFTEEIYIENSYKFSDIFNDTSIHIFSKNKLEKVKESFWLENIQEPNYEGNLELITADIITKLKI